MPIVWCAQQLIFEGSPASIARVIDHVKAVRYPTRDMGVLPHQQMASRIGAKEEALLWRGRRNKTPSTEDADTSGSDTDLQEDRNANSDSIDNDEYFFDFQLSTSYPTYSPHLTRRVCFHGKCHKIIGTKKLEKDAAMHCSCCKLAVYCSEICLKDDTEEHKGHCEAIHQEEINGRRRRPNVKIEHFALTAADRENNAAIQRTIRLCVSSLLKKGKESFRANNLGKDASTAYHALSKSCPYLMSHILSFVGIGEGSIKGRESCTSVTWLNHGGPAYDYANIAALARQYDCQIKYLHATCDVLPGDRPKVKLLVSASGELLQESKGSLSSKDVEMGGEFRWVATNATE